MQFNVQPDQVQKKDILNLALMYLGFKEGSVPPEISSYMDKGLQDLITNSRFRVEYKEFDFLFLEDALKSLNKTSSDLETYLEGCSSFIAICCTLGMEQELFSRRLQKTNMSYGVTVDAIASAYLEFCCDQFEKTLELKNPTFRFAPGYGDIPLELNKNFAEALKVSKTIGVTITPSNLFLPQKSMLGLIGLGENDNINRKQNCTNCVRYNDCSLRKEGHTCYSQK